MRLWLGLAWLLLLAPGAAGQSHLTGYPHLEGDVRWRRLFSSTHFFLRVDSSGRVQGTRWRHGRDSIMEIRSVRVGTVVIKAVYSGFYVAMNRRGHLYGSRVYSVDCRFWERIEENGYNTYVSRRWRHRGRPMFLALDGRGTPRRGHCTCKHNTKRQNRVGVTPTPVQSQQPEDAASLELGTVMHLLRGSEAEKTDTALPTLKQEEGATS
ncbi:fibroblast growth factor 22 isoform X1 [Nannospalax galili]|uniref:fibroblast growth factor 22 isoform X1 n=2 Tax=Nannospalax galili TaxID=1026970 RepID=UPI00111C74DF|nr:fibroblast growth factor 22 isoform X1 [Nannospalax galili]